MHARSAMPIHQQFHGVAREVNGQIVAAFGYDNFQELSCAIHCCVDEPWGLNRSLLSMAFRIPFEQWGYNCLISIIDSGNVKSLNLAERLGFVEFAKLPGAHPSGALHFGAMYRDKCRWLKPAERKR